MKLEIKYAKRNVLTLEQIREIYDFFIENKKQKSPAFLATYISEKYKINITRQVISRVIGNPTKFQNLSVDALRRKRIIPIVNYFEKYVYLDLCAAVKFSVLN
jgi:ribosomal protein S18